MSISKEYIKKYFSLNGITASEHQTELLAAYLDMLLEKNRVMNLTAVKTEEDGALLHITDCATSVRYLEKGTLLDVGSGAGLPSFVIAILRPDISVTALDATKKKCVFISETARALGIDNIKVLCGRAEELGNNPVYRERYNFVTARAVADLRALSELCLPLVKVGGYFVAMKGGQGETEEKSAKSAISQLGGKIIFSDTFTLFGGEEQTRVILKIEKTSKTPLSFPRPYARISKKPL